MSQRHRGPDRAGTPPESPAEQRTPAVYLPRNVVNAPDVKAAIAARSSQRGDELPVRAWLENHFFRWLVGSFENAVPIQSLQHYAELLGPSGEVPAWFARKCATAPATGFYIHPEHPLLVDRERTLVEFLNARRGTRLAEKLQRITCTMALGMWEKEHARMQARRGKGWVPSSGRALKECLRTPNGVIFEFMGDSPHLREEMAYESFHMQHCLGQFADKKRLTGGYGEQYAEGAQAGRLRLFTLRGAANQPHVTLSLQVNDDGLAIDQIKGKQNRHPVRRYADDVLQFLRCLGPVPERHPDCEGMGLVHETTSGEAGQWKSVADIRSQDLLLSVMNNNPHLIDHFDHPPASLQWLMLTVDAACLAQLKHLDPSVGAAACVMSPGDPPDFSGTQDIPRWLGPWQRGDTDTPGEPRFHVEGIPLGGDKNWLTRLFGA